MNLVGLGIYTYIYIYTFFFFFFFYYVLIFFLGRNRESHLEIFSNLTPTVYIKQPCQLKEVFTCSNYRIIEIVGKHMLAPDTEFS